MTAIVFLESTLKDILSSGFEWHCSVNPEREDMHPKEYVAVECESMMFQNRKAKPTRVISPFEFNGVTEVILDQGTHVRIYTRK